MDSVATFVDALRQCRALDAAQLDELTRTLLPRFATDSRGLAGELLKRGWLTPFQVNRLLVGRGRDLLVESYLLLDRLGEGGMGQVFKARNKLDKIVALKLIRKDLLSNATAVGRFRREIEATAQLDHPNIIRETDAGETEAGLFIVMDYVEGIDLGKLVRERGPLPPPAACDYIRQAARGLQHAHEKGLIHRDIKPGNLLRANDGHVIKLLDLGLARLQEQGDGSLSPGDRPALTQLGVIVGTVDFIAPEQARDSRRVDARADLYSLGCTFYYLLSGRAPFAGGTPVEKILKHAQEPPPELPQMPPPVMAIVHRLMAKKPEDRYASAAEVAGALDALLAHPEQLRISRSSDQLAPTVPLVELPPAPLATVPRGRTSKPVARVTPAAARSRGASGKRPELPPPAEIVPAPVAPSRVLAGEPAPVAQIVLEPVPVPQPRRRSRTATVLKVALVGCALVGVVLGIRALSPSGSSDEPSSQEPKKPHDVTPPVKVLYSLPLQGEKVRVMAWSPGGKRLAVAVKGDIHAHDGFSGDPILTRNKALWAKSLAWPEGGNLLAAVSGDGRVRLWEVDSGRERRGPDFLRADALAVVGIWVAASTKDNKGKAQRVVTLWNADTGQTGDHLQHEHPLVALAAQRNLLASADRGGVIKLWEIQSDGAARRLKAFTVPADSVSTIALGADGRKLAAGGSGGIFVWDIASAERRQLAAKGKVKKPVLAFGPQDRLVWADGDGRLHLCDTRSGTEKKVLRLGVGGLRLYPEFRADGLAVAGSNGAVYHFPLSALDTARTEDVLLVLLRDPSAARLEAIQAVKSEGIKAAVPVLERLLQGKRLSDSERTAATEALRKLQHLSRLAHRSTAHG